jgi:hypothetical protein
MQNPRPGPAYRSFKGIMKLIIFDLDQFAVFAEEARNRSEMVRITIARDFHALTVAVAPGFHSKEVTASYHPDHFFGSLIDTEKVLEAIEQIR